MDLLAFEQKLDATIMRKRLEIQEGLKKPIKVSAVLETHENSCLGLNSFCVASLTYMYD